MVYISQRPAQIHCGRNELCKSMNSGKQGPFETSSHIPQSDPFTTYIVPCKSLVSMLQRISIIQKMDFKGFYTAHQIIHDLISGYLSSFIHCHSGNAKHKCIDTLNYLDNCFHVLAHLTFIV